MTARHRLLVPAALLLVAAAAPQPQAAGETRPPAAGFRADYLLELDRLTRRTLALAREIPAERWAEPPGPGIHSIDECFGGLAAASRRTLIGMERAAPPATEEPGKPAAEGSVPPTAKDRRVAELTAVLAAARRAVEETSDDGLGEPIDFLGRRWTVRGLFLLLLGQTHEGLGHAAALAEVLGVPPPWVRLRRASEASGDD